MDKLKHPSLAEVAAAAGVSISTVSKVANGATDVSDATRARVEQILDEREYLPVRKRRAPLATIMILARDMRSPFTLECIRGAVAEAESASVRIAVAEYPRDARGVRWIDEFTGAGVEGLIALTSIFTTAQRSALAARGIPLVLIDPVHEPDQTAFSIGSTNWKGAYEATGHLLSLGHTKIAMLGGLRNEMASRARVSGYKAALEATGIHPPKGYLLDQDFTFDSGIELAEQLFGYSDPPTAVVTASDFQALGVIEAARRHGLRVPEDLSIVGFDDLVIAQMSSPPLTTVHQQIDLMGATAVQTLLSIIAGDAERLPRRTELDIQLIVRASTISLRK